MSAVYNWFSNDTGKRGIMPIKFTPEQIEAVKVAADRHLQAQAHRVSLNHQAISGALLDLAEVLGSKKAARSELKDIVADFDLK